MTEESINSSQSDVSFIRRSLSLLIKGILTAVLVYFVYDQIADRWDAIEQYQWRLQPLYLAASLLLGLATLFLYCNIWRIVIGAFGYPVGAAVAFKVSYLSNLGRYIPGKVWQLVGLLYLTRKQSIPSEQVTASFVIVQLFSIPASILVFVLAAQLEPSLLVDQVDIMGKYSALLLTAGMLAISGAIVLFPQKILSVINKVLARLSRPQLEFDLDKKVALAVFVGYFLVWVAYGSAFWLLTLSVTTENSLGLVAGIGVFNAAYQIGYLALFAPGGVGPREFVMGILLAPFIGPVGAAVAVVARLWSLALESLAAVIALMIRK